METREPTQERRGDQTRRQIFAAAEKIFARDGYHGASISEIMQTAQLGLGTFYVHFPSKLELFRFILQTRRAQWTQEAQRAAEGVDDERIAARRSLANYFNWIAERPALLRMFREAEAVDPALAETLYLEPARVCAAEAARAMDGGVIERADPDVVAWYVLGVAEFAVLGSIAWHHNVERMGAFVDIVARTLGLPAEFEEAH